MGSLSRTTKMLLIYAVTLAPSAWASFDASTPSTPTSTSSAVTPEAPRPTTAGRSCSFPKDDLTCMACNIWFEARGEGFAGQVAVGKTVMSRAASKLYPKNVCSVVYDKEGAWQFSWVGEHLKMVGKGRNRHRALDARLPKSGPVLASVEKAARAALAAGPNGATRYYANYIRRPRDLPRDCHMVSSIGRHMFFSCPGDLTATEIATARFKAAQKYGHVAHPRILAEGQPLPVPRYGTASPVVVAQADAEPVQPVASRPTTIRRPVQQAALIDDDDDEPGFAIDTSR